MNLFLDGLTDERMIKKFEKHVPQILEGMLKVYGSQNKLGMHGKTQALKVFYLCLLNSFISELDKLVNFIKTLLLENKK